jgi:hypothetical protein
MERIRNASLHQIQAGKGLSGRNGSCLANSSPDGRCNLRYNTALGKKDVSVYLFGRHLVNS